MTALSAASVRPSLESPRLRFDVPLAAAAVVYKGGIVCVNASGYGVPGADASGFLGVIGVAAESKTGGTSAGDVSVIVEAGVFQFAATAVTQGMLGAAMYVVDDNTVDNSSTNGQYVGPMVKFVSTTLVWVAVNPGALGFNSITASAAELNRLHGIPATAYIQVAEEVTFTETAGTGVYTGSVSVPAGSTILDVVWRNTAVWTANTSATMKAGVAADDDMFFTAVNVKSAPAADGTGGFGGISAFKADTGGGAGSGFTAYNAGAVVVSGIVTVSGTTGTAGRSRMLVKYVTPTASAAAKV